MYLDNLNDLCRYTDSERASAVGLYEDSSMCRYEDDWWCDELPRKSYSADFETTTVADDCRVWAVAVCEVTGETPEVWHGTTVAEFLDWCECHAPCDVYFHNLSFDGAFIFDYILKHGWTWVEDRDHARDRTFTTLISDTNNVYCFDLYFTRAYKVRFIDSYKVAPLSVEMLAGAYGLPIAKGSIDYEAPRPIGHVLTEEETDYIDGDVLIVSAVMDRFHAEGLRKITAGSNALSDYIKTIGGKKGFRRWFPELDDDMDAFVRKAYRGGWTYCNPVHQGVMVGAGKVYDVNSLYPSVMYGACGERMPYGKPLWFDGKPGIKGAYNLWVAEVTCRFRIKDGRFPCIQLKGNHRFGQTEYLCSSEGDVTFMATNVDWELICEQYHVYNVRWHGGYMFKSDGYLFRKYIDKWVGMKVKATEEGNAGLRTICKLMLNSLYGKFGTRTTVYSRKPVLVDGVVRYVDLEPQKRDPLYVPVAVFVTSYGRAKTVRAAQQAGARFLYADTDSVHVLGSEPLEVLDVHPTRLGAWDNEADFSKAKYIGAKCYVEDVDGMEGLTVKVAGMPSRCHSQVTFENFEPGAVYDGKLYPKRVSGGIVLAKGTMEIKER